MRADDSIDEALGDLQSGDNSISVQKTREWIINKVLPAGEEMYQALRETLDYIREKGKGTFHLPIEKRLIRQTEEAIAKYEALRGNNG